MNKRIVGINRERKKESVSQTRSSSDTGDERASVLFYRTGLNLSTSGLSQARAMGYDLQLPTDRIIT
jgi:hypothetical protein